jgi:XTP/dITP diphosphohydrolase
MDLLLATGNAGKIREMESILKPLGLTLRNVKRDFPTLPEPEEDGATFEENALKKARAWMKATGITALADDSGLEVDALGGGPGIHSARYAETTGARNAKLLAALSGVSDEERTARFVCVAALVRPDGTEVTRRGELPGRIATEPSGEGGFGYDPLMWLDERGCTVASLAEAEKNRISHRARAVEALIPTLREWKMDLRSRREVES